MYCSTCGEKIPGDSKFCQKCGEKIPGAEPASGVEPTRRRRSKKLGIFLIILALSIIVPFISYIFSSYGPATYKHPTKGFSFTYYKSLKIETPALPADSTCKTAAPCLVVLKNGAYDNYIVNWLLVISAADAKMKEETFITGATKGFEEDLTSGLATTIMVGDKKLYKYENNLKKSADTMGVFAKMVDLDPSLQKTMYATISGDSVVVIFFQKPPPGAPGVYTNYLNISSLIIP